MILQVNINDNCLHQQAGRIYYTHGVIQSFQLFKIHILFSPECENAEEF
jgi:hypothetical protein